jgi:pimeloyl-ACP methyl ester carboxylesterase
VKSSIEKEDRIMDKNKAYIHSEESVENVGPSKIKIVYQRFGDRTLPPVFLIMGAGAQMINWPEGFCLELASCGLHPIRFDNRDAGLSTHFSDAPVPDFPRIQSGDFSTVTYTLSDMAADTVGLMDALGYDSVHLVGASMGGMIAQTIAIEFPHRVRSLTSMMSTTGHHSVGQADYAVLAGLGSPPYDDRQAYIDWQIKSRKAIGSPKYPLDEKYAAEIAGMAWDRDHDSLSMMRQAAAVIKSGDRTEKLHSMRIPTLVIHGENDKMIDISGGRATAAAITDAELVTFEGMGHDLPKPLWSEFATRIANLIHRAEALK